LLVECLAARKVVAMVDLTVESKVDMLAGYSAEEKE
jgi:hypothetical protein